VHRPGWLHHLPLPRRHPPHLPGRWCCRIPQKPVCLFIYSPWIKSGLLTLFTYTTCLFANLFTVYPNTSYPDTILSFIWTPLIFISAVDRLDTATTRAEVASLTPYLTSLLRSLLDLSQEVSNPIKNHKTP
jgi:hypothetical protein